MRSWKAILSFTLAGALSAIPIWAANVPAQAPNQQPAAQQQPAGVPQPGMVNYVEGQAMLAGQPINKSSVGTAEVGPGQALTTQNGRVELLLTPGVMLRLDNNSTLMMNSGAIENTEATLQSGRAMVEADEVLKANFIAIHEGPASIRIMTKGLYDFDAAHNTFRVFDGRAEVNLGGKTYTVQGGHQFDLTASKLKARGFDKKANEDAFYRWGSLRASYLAEANVDAARGLANGYYGYGPSYAYDPGWFWDPSFSAYTWLPGDGMFWDPFGWGFYSPGFAFAAPFYGYGYGGYHYAFGPGYRAPMGANRVFAGGGNRGGVMTQSGFRGGLAGGGYRGGVMTQGGFHGGGFAGGGFHGGGGGFHGGGGGHR